MLAPQILALMPKKFDRLVEPFAGMAAITMAVAKEARAASYLVNDLNGPLVKMLETAVVEPEALIHDYSKVWGEQFCFDGGHIGHFYHVRDKFNSGEETPAHMLYLLARCVKGAVRYCRNGHFNQSPDKRRHGVNPKKLAASVRQISLLLKGKATFTALDYHEVFDMARRGDVVYMDPPYQGVTNVRDNRYFAGVEFAEFADAIDALNCKGIDFLISYDGECGGVTYGNDLPVHLGCTKILLRAGLSTQATLLGKRATTYEALYVSKGLTPLISKEIIPVAPDQLKLFKEPV